MKRIKKDCYFVLMALFESEEMGWSIVCHGVDGRAREDDVPIPSPRADLNRILDSDRHGRRLRLYVGAPYARAQAIQQVSY